MGETNIEDYVLKDVDTIPTPVNNNPQLDQVSKMILNPKDIKAETLPTAMAIGDLPQVGVASPQPLTLPKWLLSHPAVERAIEFKFNRMIRQLDKEDIGNNVIPKDETPVAIDAWKYCVDILKNSANQPVAWIKQFGRDAMRMGDNYLMLLTNKSGDKVLRWELQNPIFFSPMFTEYGKNQQLAQAGSLSLTGSSSCSENRRYKINPKTKKPSAYTQLKRIGSQQVIPTAPDQVPTVFQSTCGAIRLVPFGKEFLAGRVVQLNFDRLGDEPLGIPIAQTLWNTVNQIIKVEDAGTQTMINFGYNRWIANTKFRTKERMQQFGKSIENIAKKSTIILPEGIELKNIEPGSTEFDKVHNILLSLVAMRMGISVVQLKGEGADINKSTLGAMMKDVRNDFFADELEIESAMNDGFIKSCIIKYKLRTTQQLKDFPFPRFSFSEMQEDEDVKSIRMLKQSLALRNVANAVKTLNAEGYADQSTVILNNYLSEILPKKQFQILAKEKGAIGNSNEVDNSLKKLNSDEKTEDNNEKESPEKK